MDGFILKCNKCGKEISLTKSSLQSYGWPNKQEYIDRDIKEHGLIFISREDGNPSIECDCGNKLNG